MMLWAHNGHVERESSNGLHPMGSLLAARYGDGYLSIGFAFADGSFQAIAMGEGAKGLREHTVGPPPETDASTAFLRAGVELGLVDLRAAPAAVAAWFAAPHPMRELGAGFLDEASVSESLRLSRRFDALLFVAHTTRARPNSPRSP